MVVAALTAHLLVNLITALPVRSPVAPAPHDEQTPTLPPPFRTHETKPPPVWSNTPLKISHKEGLPRSTLMTRSASVLGW